MEQTVAAAFVRALRELALAKGADPAELDRRSGIRATAFADSDARIPLENYKLLLRAGQELSGDPALALHFGEAADLAELSIVGLMGEASTDFGEAFAALGRYARLAIDVELEEGAEGRLVLARRGGRLWMVDKRKDPNEFPEITESAFARMVTVARRFGTLGLITAVHFTHKQPPYVAEYARIFPMPIVFGSRWNALQLKDDSWSAITPRLPSPYMAELLRARADELLQTLDRVESARGAVEKALLGAFAKGGIGMGEIARLLGVSRPTLFRRLRQEGVTFQQILAELRLRLAAFHLADGRSVRETSQLLRFADPASFSRAFKRWTGKSPRSFAQSKGPA